MQLTRMSTTGSQAQYGQLQSYEPPPWASKLKVVPKTRIPLCMAPTPVHRWRLPGLPSPFSVWVKRDDLTGSTLSGNKARKAEFLLADAVERGCDCIVTFGSLHSNHARVMSIAARELGLDAVLFIRGGTPLDDPAEVVGCQGNMLMSRLAGATIIRVPKREGLTHHEDVVRIQGVMEAHVDKMRSEGRKPYLVPAGGFTPLGEWGYLHVWEELRGQRALDDIDDVVVAIGSGGTACAVAISNYLTGSKVKVHAVSLISSADVLYRVLGQKLQTMGVEGVESRDLIDVIDDHIEGGYGIASRELKELVISVMSETGIALDTTYTAKAVRGLLCEMRTRPERFRGNRILFIHTGGVFNLFNGELDQVVKDTPTSSCIHGYQDS